MSTSVTEKFTNPTVAEVRFDSELPHRMQVTFGGIVSGHDGKTSLLRLSFDWITSKDVTFFVDRQLTRQANDVPGELPASRCKFGLLFPNIAGLTFEGCTLNHVSYETSNGTMDITYDKCFRDYSL